MTGVSTLLPDLRRIITGPLDISMEGAIFDASALFCRRSELIVLSRKLSEWSEGKEIEVSDNYDLQACQILRLSSPKDGRPYKPGTDYHASSPNSLVALVDINNAEVWYASEPRKESGLIPEILVEHYRYEVSSGAAAALYLQPDRPWTDPRRSAEYQARFTEGIRQASRFRKNNSAPEHTEFSNPTRRRGFF